MRMINPIDASILNTFPSIDEKRVDDLLCAGLATLRKKIIVLDDDPTGVQTVHNISVYTDWKEETLAEGFAEDRSMFFVLTNSRGFIQEQTIRAHQEIARNVVAVSQQVGMDFLLISRSDSTLRGHYPIETQTLKEEIERLTPKVFDGEIICPFFKEGGRFTIDNIHYVKEGDQLTPAGLTEFARDKTFGYHASHLGEWCKEKTNGVYRAEDITYISLADLRAINVDAIENQLLSVKNFNKVIVMVKEIEEE